MIALFTALLLSGPALATGGPDLAIEGACPGPATVDMTGLTPNGRFALFTAEDVGTQVFAGGPCPGLALDLSLSSMLVNGRANGAGEIHVSPDLTPFVCGRAVQIVDVATCQTSQVVFVDGDGDGFARPDDCDDLDPAIFPGALETTADGVDQDCDGVDDCFADLDGDGFGGPIVVPGTSLTCAGSRSRSDNDADCDDADPLVNPLAAEIPVDGLDQDCDARELCFADADGDGFGAADGTTVLSAPGALSCIGVGLASAADDCDDADGRSYPGALELCDDRQNDCSDAGWVVDGDADRVTWFGDGGAPVDLSSAFAAGAPGAPASVELRSSIVGSTSGRLAVCSGTYDVALLIDTSMSEVDIEGLSGGGATPPHLDGGTIGQGLGPVAHLSLSDLSFAGNVEVYPWGWQATSVLERVHVASGYLWVAGQPAFQASATLVDVTAPDDLLLQANFTDATRVAGPVTYLYDGVSNSVNTLSESTVGRVEVNGAYLLIDDVEIRDASGDALFANGSTVEGQGLTISQAGRDAIAFAFGGGTVDVGGPLLIDGVGRNVATVPTGATLSLADGTVRDVAMGGFDVYGDLSLTGVLVEDANTSGSGFWSGAFVRVGGSLTCVGGSSGGGFVDNSGGDAAVRVGGGFGVSTLVSTGCDWGTPGVDDNAPADVYLDGVASPVNDYAGVATFTCRNGSGVAVPGCQ